ncbi:hypothetical protein [Phenylobacterium sp.]|uniref:M61 family metallopeptidase n=1 Tax=Phenylobacterium sp. TaxID=1871053 RepID=UPI00301D7FA7
MRRVIQAILAALILAAAHPAWAAEPPWLDLVMTPKATGGGDSRLAVRMTLEAPGLKAGEGLVRLPLSLVGIPSARYDGQALTARDARGPLALFQSEEPPTPQGVYRRWSVGRATVGDVTVSFDAPPRRVTAATNNGPLFDLREDAGGFIGAGVTFLATPVKPGPWRVRLKWDLSAAPPGSRGVWSMGEGDVERTIPSDALAFSYYAAGPLKSYPAEGGEDFAVYWLPEPPFDAAALGEQVRALYASMAKFFDDAGGSYRVFIRTNPFPGTGGTALARSFAFGYLPSANPTLESLQGLVAHEMAHTWPAMQGEHGDTAWYSEGAAEYYSLFLSWRAGAVDVGRVVKTLNERAEAYYANPHRALSNPEASKIFWTDPVAQTVPYGRGFLYLVRTEAAIREASGGRRSLDDVVKALRQRQVKGEGHGVADWLALVGAEIGAERAKADYEHMAAGGLLTPPPRLYAPCLKVEATTARPLWLGFARSSLNDDRVVAGLEAGSPAAAAGLRDGDVIVEASDFNVVRRDPAATMDLTVRRGEEVLKFGFLPRAAPVEAWRWARDPAAPETSCRF